ncbi:MAG: ABC-F family ATP-binding cassette domain-containing protein [Actinomycetota bacterium]
MLSLSGVSKSYGPRTLFQDLSLQIFEGERVCLVGPNGVGKTTLLRIITGELAADEGKVELLTGRRLGTLEQETDHLRGMRVIDAVTSAAPAMTEAGERLKQIAHELPDTSPELRDRLLAEQGRLQTLFEALDGYRVEARAYQILDGLAFTPEQANGPTDDLSGGWLMRVALARLLIAAPDLMLLDEPTNHLDLESVRWLEAYLRESTGAVMVISHDRDFMDAIATRIIELSDRNLESYTGNYASFVEQRTLRMAQLEKAAALQAKRVEQLERFIVRFRAKNTKATQAKSKQKMLDKMDRIEAPHQSRRKMGLRFPPPPHHSDIPVALQEATFGYDPARPIYREISVALERGMKAALVGPNGAGKTTLLKLFAGALEPQRGRRVVPPNSQVGYFAQHQIESMDPNNRVIEELSRAVPSNLQLNLRGLLGRFLFSGEAIDKPVSVLSGGERTRLALCKLLVSPFSVLCLDEPTNHLDLQSRDTLEEALEEYEGALLLITHDRHLIRSVANTIIEVKPGGQVRLIRDDYETYLSEVAEDQEPSSSEEGRPSPSQDKERKRREAEERQARSAIRKQVKSVESELEALRLERQQLEAFLADPSTYAQGGDAVADAVKRHGELDQQIASLEERWLELVERAEA